MARGDIRDHQEELWAQVAERRSLSDGQPLGNGCECREAEGSPRGFASHWFVG